MNYRTLAALILSLSSLSANARWFEVELLVFERNIEIQDLTEQLSSEAINVDTSNSISMLKANKSSLCLTGETCLSQSNPTVITSASFDSAGNNFTRLSSSHLKLVAQRERLKKHAGFNPVLHMAWRMPISSSRSAKPIHLFAGENLATDIPNTKTPKIISVDATGAISTDITPDTTNYDKWAIDGNFKIYLDHFLYVDSQLVIRKAVKGETKQVETVELIDDLNGVQIAKQAEATTPVTATKTNRVIKEILFDQNRRMRSEEIHYLDHPLMGIIVQIRKLD